MILEAESAALAAAVDGQLLAASELVRTELRRAAARFGAPFAAVEALLDRLMLIRLEATVLDAAGRMEPSALRSLDAIHVQSALVLGGQLEALVTYDARMADAARGAGLRVLTPA